MFIFKKNLRYNVRHWNQKWNLQTFFFLIHFSSRCWPFIFDFFLYIRDFITFNNTFINRTHADWYLNSVPILNYKADFNRWKNVCSDKYFWLNVFIGRWLVWFFFQFSNILSFLDFLPYTPRHDFSPMDCTDIVIGSARGTASRIWDYYTRDR